jgi:hypothetical protein
MHIVHSAKRCSKHFPNFFPVTKEKVVAKQQKEEKL